MIGIRTAVIGDGPRLVALDRATVGYTALGSPTPGNDSARALYASAGFVVEGVLRDESWLDGRSVDDVLMARPLP